MDDADVLPDGYFAVEGFKRNDPNEFRALDTVIRGDGPPNLNQEDTMRENPSSVRVPPGITSPEIRVEDATYNETGRSETTIQTQQHPPTPTECAPGPRGDDSKSKPGARAHIMIDIREDSPSVGTAIDASRGGIGRPLMQRDYPLGDREYSYRGPS